MENNKETNSQAVQKKKSLLIFFEHGLGWMAIAFSLQLSSNIYGNKNLIGRLA